MSTQEKILEQEIVETLEREDKLYEVVVFNDEVNTFDYVIQLLIDVCDHDPLQAEQCTLLIHYKGKCAVKTGAYDELEPICSLLLDGGLTAEIQ